MDDGLEVKLGAPTDLLASFRLHRFGSLDPTFRLSAHTLLQAVHTPNGPAVLQVRRLDSEGERFRVRARGEGAQFLLERADRLLGQDDRPEAFEAHCAPVRRLIRAAPQVRITRAASLFALLVITIFQQRVAWRDAARGYRDLVLRHGRRAPAGLRLPPEPEVWAKIPLADFSALEIDRRRADTVRRVAKIAGHVERTWSEPLNETRARLRTVPGLGPWTVESFMGFGLGDPDAVPLGDYDLPHRVALLFRGEARSNDEEMLKLLTPYAGQRWRIIRMIHESGIHLPRFAPRRGTGPRRRRGG